MDTNILISTTGFSEMYEWATPPDTNNTNARFGKFVQFSKKSPGKIEPFHSKNGIPIGVTTVEGKVISDNPEFWKGQFLYNEYGDAYLGKDVYIKGVRKYDHVREFSFISTEKEDEYVPISSQNYDSSLKYVKRSNRIEWIKVNLLGKTIVVDDGTLKPGDLCTPYIGDDKSKFGIAVMATMKSKYKYYVLERQSDNTVIILNK